MKITHRSTPVAIAALLIASSGAAQAQSVFSDVPDNHWAAAAVKTLVEAGIIEGYSSAPRSTPVAKKAAQKKTAAVAKSVKKPAR